MKGTIIGTDLLEFNDSVKILEINTNTTIFNSGANLLDYTGFFDVLLSNSINELHFIYNPQDAYITDNGSLGFEFEEILKTKCEENDITYFSYKVPKNSVTVPYIEDTSNKFILRQAFDTTAVVDETYCADKFEFFKLMEGSEYAPKTYLNNGNELSVDTFDSITSYTGDRPNTVKKSRYPNYDAGLYPEVSRLNTAEELEEAKTLANNSTFLLQEFIYDDSNIVNNRWNIIRSVDILYGSELDVLNMGSYRTSTMVEVDAWEDEYESNGTQLTKKSRYKWVNKTSHQNDSIIYIANADSLILGVDGNNISLNDLNVGDNVQSVDFVSEDGKSPSGIYEEYKNPPKRWSSTLAQTISTISTLSSEVKSISSGLINELFIKITLENGVTWNDLPNSNFFVETAGGVVQYDKLNTIEVGDKLLTYNKTTGEISTKLITGLEVVYDEVTAYDIDVEPSDLFLVDITGDLFAIQHNVPGCDWCGWYYSSFGYCGSYNCNYGCPECSGGVNKL
jgi:hypothetical protein